MRRESCRRWQVSQQESNICGKIFEIFLGERYVYKFVCSPDALFQMTSGGGGGGAGGGGGGGGGVPDHHRMLKLEPGNQCVGPDNTNQFCEPYHL